LVAAGTANQNGDAARLIGWPDGSIRRASIGGSALEFHIGLHARDTRQASRKRLATAGLLARGSSPSRRLPGLFAQWQSALGSSLTVAGTAAELGFRPAPHSLL